MHCLYARSAGQKKKKKHWNPNIKELIQENNNTIQNNNTTIIPAYMDKQRPNLPKYLFFIFYETNLPEWHCSVINYGENVGFYSLIQTDISLYQRGFASVNSGFFNVI